MASAGLAMGACLALMAVSGCGGKSTVSIPTTADMPFIGTRDRVPRPASEITQSLFLPSGDRRSSVLELQSTCPGEVYPANPFEFRIRAINLSGSTTLRDVVVLQELPPYVTLSSTTPTAVSDDRPASVAGNVVFGYHLGEIPPGESREVTGRAVSPDSGVVGFRLSGEYSSVMDWQAPVVEPRVTVSKTSSSEVLSCEPIEYTVTIKNVGSGIARRLTITEQLPNGLTSNGIEAFEELVGDLAPGEERVVKYTAEAERPGVFESFVMLHGNGIEVESNRVTTTVVRPVLALSRTPLPELAEGQEATYTITVANEGNGIARDLLVEETLPTGTSFRAATSGGVLDGDKVRWSSLELAVGATQQFEITVARRGDAAVTLRGLRATADCAEDAILGIGQ
jgi:uncharacterized repeat protein (TIGR01451 family)